MALCEAKYPVGAGWWKCPNLATARYQYMCVHEHYASRQTCDEHKPEPGAVGCKACFDLGHNCELVAQQ